MAGCSARSSPRASGRGAARPRRAALVSIDPFLALAPITTEELVESAKRCAMAPRAPADGSQLVGVVPVLRLRAGKSLSIVTGPFGPVKLAVKPPSAISVM